MKYFVTAPRLAAALAMLIALVCQADQEHAKPIPRTDPMPDPRVTPTTALCRGPFVQLPPGSARGDRPTTTTARRWPILTAGWKIPIARRPAPGSRPRTRSPTAFLEAIPQREPIQARLTEIWNYERFGTPTVRGGRYFFLHNNGLQDQSELWVADGLDAEPRVLLDPNTFSDDGTISLAGWTSPATTASTSPTALPMAAAIGANGS